MIAKWRNNRVTIINAAGFLCVDESENDATAKLVDAGFSPEQATAILYTPVLPATWRATWAAAAALQLAANAAALKTVATAKDVADIRKSQETLQSGLAYIESELTSDRREQEIRRLEAYLDAEAQKCRDALAANRQTLTHSAENFIWKQLWATPAGQRLQELRA